MLPGITPSHLAFGSVLPGNDAFTQLLCHFDQANGATSIIDGSQNHATGTCSGGSAITTAQFKFGTGALQPNADSQILTFPNAAWYVLGSNEFTFDFWCRMQTLPTTVLGTGQPGWFCGRGSAMTNGWSFGIGTAAGGWKLGSRLNGVVTSFPNLIATASLTVNTWHHYAFVRDNVPNPDVLRAFYDGIDLGIIALTEGQVMPEIATIFTINGAINIAVNRGISGVSQYEEFRFSNKARWRAAFTPPLAAYVPIMA